MVFRIDDNERRERVEGDQNIYDTVINSLIQTGEAENYFRNFIKTDRGKNFLKDNLDIEQDMNPDNMTDSMTDGQVNQDTTFKDLGDLDDLENAKFHIFILDR